TATVTINLTNVNEAPDVLPTTLGLAENSTLGTVVGTVSASDVDAADVLSFAIMAGNTGGAFAIDTTTGQITVFNPSLLDFESLPAWTLTVRVTDTSGLFDTAGITINLNDVNENPDILSTTFNLSENLTAGTLVGTATASDVDFGDTLTYTITAGNAGGAFSIDATTGQVTVSNPSLLDFESSPVWTLTVRVADSGGLFDTATVTVNLTNANEAPDVLPATFLLPENSPTDTVVGIVSANDVDAGDTPGFTITAGNTGGTFSIDPATGRITVNDSTLLDFETNAGWTLTVRVTDAGGLSDTTAVTVNLVNVNESPNLPPVTFSSPENSATGTTVGTVSASDLDAGDMLSFAITAGNAGGTFAIDAATGQITVLNPSLLDFETTPAWMLTVRVTDTGGLSDLAAVTINLTNVNETPAVLPAIVSLAENSATSTVVATVSANDVDAADVIGFAITSGNTGGTFAIDATTGQITVSAPSLLDFETTPVWTLTVRATDATGLFDSAAVTINLTNINETPDVLPATFSLVENSTAGTLVGTVFASDVDAGDVLSHAITAGNPSGAFAMDSTTGQIVVVNPGLIDFETTSVWTLTVSVTDGGGLSDSTTISVNLTDVNEAPTILPATLSLTENPATGTVAGSVSASDLDAGDVLNYAITAGNSTGAFAIDSTTGQVTVIDPSLLDFETTPGWSLSVQVTDAGGLSDSATVTINLTNVNEAPIVSVPGTQSTLEDTAILFGVATGNAITVADQDAGLGQIELTLTAVNGRLTLSAITGLTFTAGDGVDDPQLVFRGSVADVNAALDGMQFQPAANFNGLAALTVNCDDLGNSGSGSANVVSRSVLIDVAAVNDPPTSQVPGSQQTPEDTSLVFSSAKGNGITVADVEVGSGVLEMTLTAINGRLTLPQPVWLVFSAGAGTNDHSMTFTGTAADINAALDGLQFSPDSNFNGLAAVTITVNDLGLSGTGGSQSVTETVLIDVVAVNDAPQVTWPGPQTTDEDMPLAFSTAGGNAVRVDDLDANGNSIEVTLTVTHGTFTLAKSVGLTFTNGDGTSDVTLTFVGTVANINAALDGLRYTPDHDFHGAANMTLIVDDHGQSGGGGSHTTMQLGTITVSSVLDPGEISLPSLPPDGTDDGGSGPIVVATSTSGGPGPIDGGGSNETTRDVPLTSGGGNTENEAPPVTIDDISNSPPVSQPISVEEPQTTTEVETPAPVDTATIVMVPDIPVSHPPIIPGWITLSSVDIRPNSTGTTLETVGWVGSSLATMAFAGYVVWNLNYSWLVAGALAARPLWRQFDPLVILELWETSRKRTDDEEEAIRGLFG
ncbi:MAG: cadherin repeat domain-containing protein, partial [Planctomycetales bacterium]|nr:cadherin repeat domain-containing protein [Planctomycetales bacterium]